MRWFKKTQKPPVRRDTFKYVYRGYTISLTPTGLEFSRQLGRFGANVTDGLTHSQSMTLIHMGLRSSAYGNDIGQACNQAERQLDKIITFLDLDRAHTEESLQRLQEFAQTDRRFN